MADRTLNSVVNSGASTADLFDNGATVVQSSLNGVSSNFSRSGTGVVHLSISSGTSNEPVFNVLIDGKSITGSFIDLSLVFFAGDTSRLIFNYKQSISITRTDSNDATISVRSTT